MHGEFEPVLEPAAAGMGIDERDSVYFSWKAIIPFALSLLFSILKGAAGAVFLVEGTRTAENSGESRLFYFFPMPPARIHLK